MKRLAFGLLIVAAVFTAVVLSADTQAEAARVRVHVNAYYPGYYAPYPYVAGYRGYYPPVRVYAYRPPLVYAPAVPVYVPPPVYIPRSLYVPAPPCAHYRVWER